MHRKESGYGLLALAIAMAGLGLAVIVTLALLPNRQNDEFIDQTVATIEDAQNAVLSFTVQNSRLPCPDTSVPPNGLEGNSATASCTPSDVTGALPYRSLGLPAAVLDQAGLPLRYTPFKNGVVDLTSVDTDTYEPELPDVSDHDLPRAPEVSFVGVITDPLPVEPSVPTLDTCDDRITPSPANLLDFCLDLDNAITMTEPPISGSVNTELSPNGPSSQENVAYVLISGGLEDADGNALDSSLDGLNDDGDVTYEDPARGRGLGYDDIVRSTRFSTLQRELSCRALLDSVDLLVEVAGSGNDVLGNAVTAYASAETQVAMAGLSVLMDIIALAQNAHALVGLGADAGKAGGGCASLVLSPVCCPALVAIVVAIVVYAVTVIVQVAALGVDIAEFVSALNNRNLFRTDILPRANANLCDAIGELVAADQRGGLAGAVVP